MQLGKQLFNFYINSSIHVALAVVSLTWITFYELEILPDDVLLFFVFFASISGYNFVKYFGMAKFHHRSLANWLKAIQLFSLVCFLFMVYFAFKLPIQTVLYIIGFALITFFYAIPFLPKQLFVDHQSNLRSIGGLKVYLIALVWAGVTVLLPVVNNSHKIQTDVIFTLLQRFLFIVVLMFPFEIRDLRYDSIKLATIPQKIGVTKTKIIGLLLLMLFIFFEFFKDETSRVQLAVILLVSIITGLFLWFSKIEQGDYYCSFWVEGIPILWGLWLVLFG